MNYKIVIPSLAALVLTASVAMAQMAPPPQGGPMRGNRTPPTAEQMAARQARMCADRQARSDADLTYREERLSLTPVQKPLFDRWKAVVQSENAARQAGCMKPRPVRMAQRPTLPERNARMEDALKARLATLEKMRPVEEALYAALTPDQQRLFESREHRGSRMAMAGRFRGRFPGRGFGGPGGFGPGGPGGGPGPRG